MNMKSKRLETLKIELIDLSSISQDQLKQIAGKIKLVLSHDSEGSFQKCHKFNPDGCGLEYYQESSRNRHVMIGIKYVKGVTSFKDLSHEDKTEDLLEEPEEVYLSEKLELINIIDINNKNIN